MRFVERVIGCETNPHDVTEKFLNVCFLMRYIQDEICSHVHHARS